MLKDLFSRKLLKSNQLVTSILFNISNGKNCLKIQLSVCTDNLEQYFQVSLLKRQNDWESFIIPWKVFTSLKNNRLQLSVASRFLNMLYDKNPWKPGNARNQEIASSEYPWLTFVITAKLQFGTQATFCFKNEKTTSKARSWFFIPNFEQ